MRVLVTGASGFVGRAVVPVLTAAGHAVRGSGRGAPPLADLAWVTTGPLGPDTAWSAALDGVEAVVHLAGRVHVMDRNASTDDAAFLATNRDGTVRLAEAAEAAGVRHFVFMSTAKVMGEGRELPYSEADGPVPFDAYARSKLAAELALAAVAARGRMRVAILRPPLVYGPGVGANFLSLLRLVDRGLPLPLGAVRNSRSLVYDGNLAAAVLHLLTTDAYGPFLVSDGEDVSTPRLVGAMARALGKRSRLFPVPERVLRAAAGLVGRSAAMERLTGSLALDTSRLAATGFSPPFTLAQGLAETARWYRRLRP